MKLFRKSISVILAFLIVTSVILVIQPVSANSENDTLFFGRYFQDQVTDNTQKDVLSKMPFDNNYESINGVGYTIKDNKYYKTSPIEWQIIDDSDGCYTLLSKKVLDQRALDDFWSTSSMRSWLNNDFLNQAFNDKESEDIAISKVTNLESNYDNNPNGGKPYDVITNDKVYLLSQYDFLDDCYGLLDEQSRIACATQYVDPSEKPIRYWLRGPRCWTYGLKRGYYVENDGTIGNWYVTYGYGVRPVIRVNKNSTELYFTNPEDNATINTSTGVRITEDQLFYEYNKYLKNKYYDSMCGDLYDTMFDIIYGKSEGSISLSALKSNMIGGVSSCIRALFEAATGSNFTEEEIEKELAMEYMQFLSDDSTLLSDVVSDTNKELKLTKSIYTIIENGFKNKAEKEAFVKAFASGQDFYSESEIYDLIRNTESDWDKIDKIFKNAGYVVKSAEIVAMIIETQMVQTNLIKRTKGLIDKNSALYRGLTKIEKMQKHKLSSIVDYLLKTEGFERIVDVLEKQGIGRISSLIAGTGGIEVGGATAVASIGYMILGYCIPVATITDLNKLAISVNNLLVIKNAILEKRTDIILNYKNNGIENVGKLKSDYKFLYDLYFVAIDSAVEKATIVANKNQKKILDNYYSLYSKKLSVEKYIDSCLKNASANWTYTNNNGVVTIIKYENSNNVKSSSAKYRYTESNSADIGLNENLYSIDIPDEIDGNSVSKISDKVFSTNQQIDGIYIPDTVTEIGIESFSGCETLDSVYLGKNTTSIGDRAFANCKNLNCIYIPDSTTNIGIDVFSGIETVTLFASESSAGEEYANKNSSISYESKEKAIKEISIESMPNKLVYNIDEEIDTSGMDIKAIYYDGSEEIIDNDIYAEAESMEVGSNTVNVYYKNAKTSYEIQVEKTECDYTVLYKNEVGEEIAEPTFGKAYAGDTVDLEIKEIENYIPITDTTTVTIGHNNEFVVYYSPIVSSVADAEFKYSKQQKYTGSPICPKVIVTSDNGDDLKENKDYTVEYLNNINPGTGNIIVEGIGKYKGITCLNFDIQTPKSTSTKITLDKSSVIIFRAEKVTIKATVKNGKGKTKFKSNNTRVAKVNSKGKVTALKEGVAKITVTNNNKSKVFTVRVINPMLNRTSVSVGRGKSYSLKVIGKIGKAQFYTSNKKIARVNSKGKITVNKKAQKDQTAIISVRTNGMTLKCRVKVK